MKCTKELFPHSPRDAGRWAIACYLSWSPGGLEPEKQRDRKKSKIERISRKISQETINKSNILQVIMDFLTIDQNECFANF